MNKIFGIIISFILVLGMSSSVYSREPLMVFAAASLSDALKELGIIFEKEYKVPVRFNLGGSLSLRLQIENGSPCDVFLAADQASMSKLVAKKMIEEKDSVNLLRNRLVIVADTDYEENFSSLYDLHLNAGDNLAIADPKIAPAGVYAMQALTKAGLKDKYQDFIVPALDVRAALALVQSGNAKYAIVYSSDARLVRHVKVIYQVPSQLHDPIIYTATTLKSIINPVPSRNFLTFLQTNESKMIFQKYGFQSF
ncbi:MAG: molybdate ABC transporter substrate-binding protein [Candidatus Omnitrophica bacterium]|nr:molybdate ABC transporter substrate-binding protein [Candidatus Omnitrophota bacterium]